MLHSSLTAPGTNETFSDYNEIKKIPNFTIISSYCLTENSAMYLMYINLFLYEQFNFLYPERENWYIMNTQMQNVLHYDDQQW